MAFLKYIKYFKDKISSVSTINHKDIGFFYVEKLKMLFKLVGEIWKIICKNIIKYWNIIILITWLILYILELLTIKRLITYTIIGIIIYGYKKIYEYTLTDKFKEKILNIKKKEKLLYYLIRINNISILMLIVNIEVKIYALIEWYQTYNYKTFNWIVLLMSMIVPLKLILSYMYTFFVNIQKHTMVEILWKRAFGLILSVLIFTNIIEILLETYKTWVTLIVLGYIHIVLIAWHDLQKINQEELTYFKHSTNTLILISKRNTILVSIIKILWNDVKLDKVKFYEKYNKKFNIIMYYILNIENYKYKKFLFQLRYLNQIKGMEELKNAKIEFLKNFNSVIISIINIMFESLNTLIYLKACFNELKIYKYINEINKLMKINYLQNQILLYFIWDILVLNKFILKDDLINMLIIDIQKTTDDIILKIVLLDIYNIIYKKTYNCFNQNYINDSIYQEIYEIYMFYNNNCDKIFQDKYINKLYKNFNYWINSDFEFQENGIWISNESLVDVLYSKMDVIKELEKIKIEIINNYTETAILNLLKKYAENTKSYY